MYNYKDFKNYLIIFILSLIFGLYLFEMYLNFKSVYRGSDIEKNRAILKKEKNLEYDVRSKHEIYKSMKLNDKNITVSVSPRVFNDPDKKLHFLSGISKSKTIDCNENGYFSIYKSDRYGFNNPDNEWKNSEIDYILVGDSYTHGACVNRPNDIASVLRNLSNKKVINLGYKANGPLSMYASLKEYKSSKTKNILWMYYEGNDLEDLNHELKIGHLKKYILNKSYFQNLKEKQDYIDAQNHKILLKSIKAWDKAREQTIKNSNIKYKILKFIRLDKTKKVFSNYQIKQEPVNQTFEISKFKEILKQTKELVEKNNSKLYFVYLPEYNRYKIKYDNTNYNLIKNIVTELNIPFISIHNEVFKKYKNPLKLFPFEQFGHYNIEGYKKVSETIYKFTKD